MQKKKRKKKLLDQTRPNSLMAENCREKEFGFSNKRLIIQRLVQDILSNSGDFASLHNLLRQHQGELKQYYFP